ncbi:Roundabout-like protein 1, partial [Harpegnathos saltator]
ATGLKDLTINVPNVVRSGDTVTLSCHYDLEGSSLYTIQWFLDNNEFYRYVFDRVPPASTFNVSGIQVNISKSNTHDVTLVDVSRKLTGWYKCEVSASSPSYHTMIKKAKMEVVDAPKTDPTIRTEKERIVVDETLRVNCTTGNSRPASTVTWKLNGDFVANNSQFTVWHHKTSHPDESKATKSQIEFKVTKDMFHGGHLHLRCTAAIADVYRKSADIDITEDVRRSASITSPFESPYDHRKYPSTIPHYFPFSELYQPRGSLSPV